MKKPSEAGGPRKKSADKPPKNSTAKTVKPIFPITGIGASAGGLEA
jgi:hypothetical protein